MKKFLLTLIVSLAFCGSIFAQQESDLYDTYWPEFNGNIYENQDPTVAFIQIDGEFVEADGNWQDLEIAPFVDGVIRGHTFMIDYTEEFGDDHPIIELSIYYDIANAGEEVTFKMYDHAQGILYEDCFVNVLGEPLTIHTGEEHTEEYYNPDEAVILSFTSPTVTTYTFTREITGYGDDTEGKFNYYLIASPLLDVKPATVDNMTTGTFDLYSFDQNGDDENGFEWINQHENTEAALVPGQGYLYANQDDVTLTFTGTQLAGISDVTLSYVEGKPLAGWNLIGNPLPNETHIDRPFYAIDGDVLAPQAGSTQINVMEGVFVYTEIDEDVVTFQEGSAKSSSMALNLTSGNSLVDRAIVNFDNDRNLPKFQLNENSTKLYIPQDNKDFAVVYSEGQGEMPVNFKAQANGSYTLSFASENTDFSYLHLIDNRTGNDVDLLKDNTYTFDANTTDYASRFKLVFATGNSNSDDFAFVSDGNIIVNGQGTVQIFDVTGRLVNSADATRSITTNGMAAGVYMLQLTNGDNVKTQKIVVK